MITIANIKTRSVQVERKDYYKTVDLRSDSECSRPSGNIHK